jgi:ribosomal protein S18 acetylase RimI-like enzyme
MRSSATFTVSTTAAHLADRRYHAAMTTIRSATADDLPSLVGLLTASVHAGASIGFLDSITDEEAGGFWAIVLEQLVAGSRAVLVADEGGRLVGTITVLLAFPPNQPHRAEIAKLMVAPGQREAGLGSRLLDAGERIAWASGKTLLVLDTESGSAAEGFYARRGWTKTGEIPDYALTPDGRLHPTSVYWKRRPSSTAPPPALRS